ncbi:MAG: AmmeMemoRadiSam system protein A [Roseivivax sp.]|nr:AmmeMemoRadiSam system protein A [Roseivivax sp.]
MTMNNAIRLRGSRVAGRFFPETRPALKAAVGGALDRTAVAGRVVLAVPRAVIAPHAGYDFCGDLIAAAWQATHAARPARIAVLSPSHAHEFAGIAVPAGHDVIALPGLKMRIDRAACIMLRKARLVVAEDAAFAEEHGIDTQLPFARTLHGAVPLVPLVVGRADPAAVARVIDAFAALPGDTLFVLSSDLSHHLPEADAQRRDLLTAARIETGQGADLTGQDACGATIIAGFLASAAGAGTRAVRLGRFTSAKTTGLGDSVVGYGAWGFYPPGADCLNDALRAELVTTVEAALASRLRRGSAPAVRVDSYPVPLRTVAASFVTLSVGGRLRGCIGSVQPRRPLISDVVDNAIRAGFGDDRFSPLTEAELRDTTVSISVLSRPQPFPATSRDALLERMVPGETGLILQEGAQRAIFLPTVWESLPDPAQFVAALKRKAGMEPDHWSPALRAHAFRTEHFSRPAG